MSATILFTVDLPTNRFVCSAPHELPEGAPVYLVTTGELEEGLESGTWFVRVVDSTSIRVSRVRSGGDVFVASDAGTGVHQIYRTGEPPAVELYRTLVAAFAGDAQVALDFGRRALARQVNYAPDRTGRIVVVPGDETGKVGKLEPVTEIGTGLYSLPELFEVHVFGRDQYAGRDDDLAHYHAAWSLWRDVVAALQAAHGGRLGWSDARVPVEPVELQFGALIVQPVIMRGGVVNRRPAARVVATTSTEFDSAAVFPNGEEPPNPTTYWTPPLTP